MAPLIITSVSFLNQIEVKVGVSGLHIRLYPQLRDAAGKYAENEQRNKGYNEIK